MPEVMEITNSHPLHPMFTFWERLPLGDDVEVTSLHMAYAYLYLQHHRKSVAAAQLLTDEQYKWQPSLIWPNLVQKEIPEPNLNVVLAAVEMMQAIVMHQVECNSAFVRAFRRELRDLGNPQPGDASFRVCTAKSEMIFSSGASYKHWQEPVRGYHFYADILEEAHEAIFSRDSIENPKFNLFTTDFEHFFPSENKSLFLVMDSQGKFFDTILGGDITAVGGGNFGHICEVLYRKPEWRRYPWVILYCGTNCRANSQYEATQREFQWCNLLDILVKEAERRNRDGSIVFCTSFEHPWVDVRPGLAVKIEMICVEQASSA